MSCLMMDGAEASQGDLLLCEADFPASYVDMRHPDEVRIWPNIPGKPTKTVKNRPVP